MAQRGPKPVPSKVLELRGSWRARTRTHEPVLQAEVPPCPKWLDAASRKMWKQVSAELSAMGILGKVDGFALARYVAMLVQWQKLQADIQAHGDTCPIYKQTWVEAHYDDEGTLIPGKHELVATGEALRPQVTLLLALSDRLLRLEQSFGMSPSARAALGLELERTAMPRLVPPLAQRDARRFLDLDA